MNDDDRYIVERHRLGAFGWLVWDRKTGRAATIGGDFCPARDLPRKVAEGLADALNEVWSIMSDDDE